MNYIKAMRNAMLYEILMDSFMEDVFHKQNKNGEKHFSSKSDALSIIEYINSQIGDKLDIIRIPQKINKNDYAEEALFQKLRLNQLIIRMIVDYTRTNNKLDLSVYYRNITDKNKLKEYIDYEISLEAEDSFLYNIEKGVFNVQ